MISHNLKQNRSLYQFLILQSSLPTAYSDFTYCAIFADHYNFQFRTYEQNRYCLPKNIVSPTLAHFLRDGHL